MLGRAAPARPLLSVAAWHAGELQRLPASVCEWVTWLRLLLGVWAGCQHRTIDCGVQHLANGIMLVAAYHLYFRPGSG